MRESHLSRNKFHARRTWSELCQRFFDSKLEATRGEELRLLEMAGEISNLCYQPLPRMLCQKPKITIQVDFLYIRDGKPIYEDAKGVLTRDTRTKLAWLKEKYGIEVELYRG